MSSQWDVQIAWWPSGEPAAVMVEDQLAKRLNNEGLRAIFATRHVVVKIDDITSCPSMRQSLVEARLLSKIDPEDQDHFPFILDYGPKWVAVERVRGFRPGKHHFDQDDMETFKRLCKKYRLRDTHGGNVGKLGGKVFFMDVGRRG